MPAGLGAEHRDGLQVGVAQQRVDGDERPDVEAVCVGALVCPARRRPPRRDERRRPGIGRRAAVDRKDDGVRDRERDELPPRGERDGRDDRPLDADGSDALPRGKDKRVAARAKPQDAVGVCPRAGPEADGEGSAAASKTHLRRRG